MYKTEAEAKIFCNLNKKCLGILLWVDSNSKMWFSHCLSPNRLIPKSPKFDRYAGTLIRKTIPGMQKLSAYFDN